MLFRLMCVAILFATPALAQQQEPTLMERITNPNLNQGNPMGDKAFEAASFSAKKFSATRGYGGVKSMATKEFGTRSFLGIRNPWFGKRTYETQAARELTRYVLSDKSFASKSVDVKSSHDAGRRAAGLDGAVDARAFLARGKSQKSLDNTHPTGKPLSIDEVRELLNRNR